ncbi:hypothetical protein ACP4OV_003454 [Aristida adscensionis]
MARLRSTLDAPLNPTLPGRPPPPPPRLRRPLDGGPFHPSSTAAWVGLALLSP